MKDSAPDATAGIAKTLNLQKADAGIPSLTVEEFAGTDATSYDNMVATIKVEVQTWRNN